MTARKRQRKRKSSQPYVAVSVISTVLPFRKDVTFMGLAEFERRKDEKVNGAVYKTEITLKEFPHIKMTLADIFEGVY